MDVANEYSLPQHKQHKEHKEHKKEDSALPRIYTAVAFLTCVGLAVSDSARVPYAILLAVVALSLLTGIAFQRWLRLPSLVGQLLAGMAARLTFPRLDDALSSVSALVSLLRSIALTVLLIRAGLGIDLRALRPFLGLTLALAVVPFVVEAAAAATISGLLIEEKTFSFCIMIGAIVGDVSPAVTTPILLRLKETYKGSNAIKSLSTVLLAASNLNSILSIDLFFVFFAVYYNTGMETWLRVLLGVVEILGGVMIGITVGRLLNTFTKNAGQSAIRLLFTTLAFVLLGKWFDYNGAGTICALTVAVVCGNVESAGLTEFFKAVWELPLEVSEQKTAACHHRSVQLKLSFRNPPTLTSQFKPYCAGMLVRAARSRD